MCIIIAKPENIDFPKDEHLINAESHNLDGIGICYHKFNDNKVIIKKDFKNVQELIKFQNENLKKLDAVIYHFRFATQGLKDEGNRHPFPITNDRNLIRSINLETNMAVVHNGVLSEFTDEKEKELSDTQLFIMDILNENTIKNNLDNEVIIRLLAEFVNPSRLALMNNKGEIQLINDFTKDDNECYYSNNNYKEPKKIYSITLNNSLLDCYRYGWTNYHSGFDIRYNIETAKNDVITTNATHKNTVQMNCDGCGQYKFLKEYSIGDNIFYLCKKCRKKAKRGKLKELKSYENTDILREKDLIRCNECDIQSEKSTMLNIQGFYICKNCIIQYKDYLI